MFLIQEVIFIANVKAPSHQKSVMNKPQSEGRVNHVCSAEEVQHSSAMKKQSTIMSLSKVICAY